MAFDVDWAKVGATVKEKAPVAATNLLTKGSVGAIGGALAVGGALAGAMSPEGKLLRKEREKDRARLAANDFKMSKAEKKEAYRLGVEGFQAKDAADLANLAREGHAQGALTSGAYAKARGELGKGTKAQIGKMTGDIAKIDTQTAIQKRQQALDRMKAHREKVAKDWGAAVAGGVKTIKSYTAQKEEDEFLDFIRNKASDEDRKGLIEAYLLERGINPLRGDD